MSGRNREGLGHLKRPAEGENVSWIIRPGVGLNDLLFGSMREEVKYHLGEPEDVGWAAVYLASPEARWVTGQLLCVDGGVTLMSPSRGVGDEPAR